MVMDKFKRLPIAAESIPAMATVFLVVLVFLTLSKFGIIPGDIASLWVEGVILLFGGVIVFLETFKERIRGTRQMFSPTTIIAVLTIAGTFYLALSKFGAVPGLGILGGFGEGIIFIMIIVLLTYELFLEARK